MSKFFKAAVVLPIGLGMVVLAGWLLGFQVPDGWRQDQAYRSAEVCADGGAGECRGVRPYTVERIRKDDGGRSDTYYLTLGGWPDEVEFGDDTPVLGKLAPGDEVRATEWRGDIVEVSARGGTQYAWRHPFTGWQTELILGMLCLAAAAVALTGGVEELRRRPRSVVRRRRRTALLAAFSTGWVVVGAVSFYLSMGGTVLPRWLPPVWAVAGFLLLPVGFPGVRGRVRA